MDANSVDIFLSSRAKCFESYRIPSIREQLLEMDNNEFTIIQALDFKDPMIILIISILGGSLGIDRIFIGDMGIGIAKLLTCGGLGIWSIIDLFLIMDRTKEKNYEKLQAAMRGHYS